MNVAECKLCACRQDESHINQSDCLILDCIRGIQFIQIFYSFKIQIYGITTNDNNNNNNIQKNAYFLAFCKIGREGTKLFYLVLMQFYFEYKILFVH